MRILPIGVGVALLVGGVIVMRPAANDLVPDGFAMLQAQEKEAAMAEQMNQDSVARFGDAPEGVTALAEIIMEGRDLDPAAIARVSPEALNASYSQPFPKKQPNYGHTLLREAVVSGNVSAAKALIAAGADPAFNDNEMPHVSVLRLEGNRNLAFGDYSTGNALVQLWLDAGGDPNVHSKFYGGIGPLLVTTPMNNLEGLMLLLKAGADPWGRVALSASRQSLPFMADYSNANGVANEVMFRLASEGLIGPGPMDEVASIVADYERVAEDYVGSPGPLHLAIMWRMQRAIGVLYPRSGETPTGATAAVMATQIPDGMGGFWLGTDETRSTDTADQIVTTDNQHGRRRDV